MGALCGKLGGSGDADAFAGAGRRLDETPQIPATAKIPASAHTSRKVGPSAQAPMSGSATEALGAAAEAERQKRLQAIEARTAAMSTKGIIKGDLAKQANERKKMSRTELLQEASRANANERMASENTKALSYD